MLSTRLGAIISAPMIALSPDFPQWPTLYDAIAAGGMQALIDAARGKAVTHTDVTYEMVMPNAPRILCVGVNFPDRNAEYKDGSAQPKYMSLFPRFASGFTGHDQPLIRPPENHTLDYEGEVAVVIGKGGRGRTPLLAEGTHLFGKSTIDQFSGFHPVVLIKQGPFTDEDMGKKSILLQTRY